MSTGSGPANDELLRDMADKFAEARMEIEDCHDSLGTTYFDEDCELCKELVACVHCHTHCHVPLLYCPAPAALLRGAK